MDEQISVHPNRDRSHTEQHPSKRLRTAVACQRCKVRKQKCDGSQPACSSCVKTSSECRYLLSTAPKASDQKLYIKRLEEKVKLLQGRLSSGGTRPLPDDYRERLQPETDVDAVSHAIRDLALNASGYSYLGGTSNITLGHLLEPILDMDEHNLIDREVEAVDDPNRDPLVTRIFPRLEDNLPDTSLLAEPIVETLFHAYIENVSVQLPFIHSSELQELHSRRKNPKDLYEICILHFIYAIGGRTLEWSGRKGDYKSDRHYQAAIAHRARVIHFIDRRWVRYLTLACLYCLRAPRTPCSWTMIGLAVKFCISLGLHRKASSSRLGLRSEMDKRLFWTCYALDHHIALTVGRPPTICDHDIDAALPLDVDEHCTDLDDFRNAARIDPKSPTNPPTSLTYFIHIMRLKRIESSIRHTIYRVDKNVNASHQIVDSFLDQLNRWRQGIPAEWISEVSNSDNVDPPPNSPLRDFYMIPYYRCVRFLLFPLVTESTCKNRYIRMCASACASLCRAYKQLHQISAATCFSPNSIMVLFLAGLTLINCMWRRPEAMSKPQVSDALADCTIMLYVMTERWPKARKYRNIFERVKRSAIDRIERGDHPQTTSRAPTNGLDLRDMRHCSLPLLIDSIVGSPAMILDDDNFDLAGIGDVLQTTRDIAHWSVPPGPEEGGDFDAAQFEFADSGLSDLDRAPPLEMSPSSMDIFASLDMFAPEIDTYPSLDLGL